MCNGCNISGNFHQKSHHAHGPVSIQGVCVWHVAYRQGRFFVKRLRTPSPLAQWATGTVAPKFRRKRHILLLLIAALMKEGEEHSYGFE